MHRLAFVLLTILLAGRPLLSEPYERVEFTFLSAMGVEDQVSPALPVALDFLMLLSATVLVLTARNIPNPNASAQRGLVFVGIAALVMAGAVLLSSAAANNARVALNAGGTLVAFTAVGLALVLRPWPQRWLILLLAAVLASGLTFATRCWLQQLVEFPALREDFAVRMTALPAESRERPDFINYQRRMASAEVYSYQSHPNIAGSLLMMWTLPLLGIGVAGVRAWRRMEDAARLAVMLAIAAIPLLGVALWWTGSAGALGSCIIAVVLFGTLMLVARPRSESFTCAKGSSVGIAEGRIGICVRALCASKGVFASRTTVFVTIAAAYVLLFGATLLYGTVRGQLPTASMAFRWYYWTSGWRAYLASPLTGIGRENFGAAYLLHKPAVSTEEVKNAHNLWITLLVELGPFGLVAGVVLIGAALWYVLPRGRRHDEDAAKSADAPAGSHNIARLTASDTFMPAGTVVGLLALQAWAGGGHFENRGWTLLWIVEVCAVWIVSFTLLVRGLPRLLQASHAAAIVQWSAAAAVVGVLVHNLVCFSLMTPAGLSLLVALLAIGHGLSLPWPSAPTDASARVARFTPWVWAPVLGALALHSILIFVPTSASQFAQNQEQLRISMSAPNSAAFRTAHDVLRLDRLDPALPRTLARAAAQGGAAAATRDEAIKMLESAADFARIASQRDPQSLATAQLRAEIFRAQAETAGESQRAGMLLRCAFAQRELAVALYPTDPRLHVRLAASAEQLWQVYGIDEWRRLALRALIEARRLDAQRPVGDVVRLQAKELAEIAALESALQETPNAE